VRWVTVGSDAELDDIRRRRMLELRKRLAEGEQSSEQREKELNAQKEAALRQILTYEARQRLSRLRLVKPEFVEQIELQLIQIAQSGRVKLPIDDRQLKQILIQLQSSRKEITFRRV
jgi:programmed cell death protein 5